MCRHSLKRRVLVSLLAVLMLGVGALAALVYDVQDQLRRGVMFIQARELASGLSADSDFSLLPREHAGGELSYTLYSPDGDVLWYSDNLERPRRLRHSTLEDELSVFRPFARSGRVINVPVTLTDGSILMVAKEDRAEREVIGGMLHTRLLHGLILLAPFCVLAAALVFALLHWTLRPVTNAARLAAGIGPSQPGQRIPLDSLPREIRPLAVAANAGLARLAKAYEYEQRIVADAAHELRTPLMVLDLRLQKSRLDGSIDWDAIGRELGNITRLVNQLLLLARQDRDAGEKPTQTLLPRVVREAAAMMLPLFEAHGRSMDIELEEGVWVVGDAGILRDALRNVLENALYHGEGQVRLCLFREAQGRVAVDVIDEGAGVVLASQEELFWRFRKGRQGSDGSGLGLAIVRSIVSRVGGDARFVGTRPCVFRMRFICIA